MDRHQSRGTYTLASTNIDSTVYAGLGAQVCDQGGEMGDLVELLGLHSKGNLAVKIL
jgi:hypothetical protein